MSRQAIRFAALLVALVVSSIVGHLKSAAAQGFAIRGRIAARGLVLRSDDGKLGGENARATLVEYDDTGRMNRMCGNMPCRELQQDGLKVGPPAMICASHPDPGSCEDGYKVRGIRSLLYKGNQPLYESRGLLAYETDFFTIDPDLDRQVGAPSSCVLDEDSVPRGTNIDDARTRKLS